MRACAGFKYDSPCHSPLPPSPRPGKEKCERRKKKPLRAVEHFLPIAPRGKWKISREKKNPGSGPCINTRTSPHRPRTAESSRRLSGVFPPGLGGFSDPGGSFLSRLSEWFRSRSHSSRRSEPACRRPACVPASLGLGGERAEALGCDGIRGRGNAEVVGAAGHRCRSLIRPRRRSAFW